MKAAVVETTGAAPAYKDFRDPVAAEGQLVVRVTASALSHFSRMRASGAHYSSGGTLPAVAGSDGVGRTIDGRRVYFLLPEAPFGSMAEQSLVDARNCIVLPESLDDVTAAAIANPGMSAWAGLVERAKLVPGETVLINGATSTAGRISVQLAKYLGAGKVIAAARNAAELEEVRSLGADVVLPFAMQDAGGPARYEQALMAQFGGGIDIILDYLWGSSALTVIRAIAKGVEDAHPVRFVHMGSASGEPDIPLPGAALRSSAIVLMGSGVKSVAFPVLRESIRKVFEASAPAGLKITVRRVPLAEVEAFWSEPGAKPRIVFQINQN